MTCWFRTDQPMDLALLEGSSLLEGLTGARRAQWKSGGRCGGPSGRTGGIIAHQLSELVARCRGRNCRSA
jgi:hypothetical protein